MDCAEGKRASACEADGNGELPVCIIDDDVGMREAIRILLAPLGYRVELFDCANCYLMANDKPQGVVILDMRLPGMSGLKLLERWNLPRSGFEVVFISGTAEVADAIKVMKAGVCDFLVKPFGDQALIDAVQSAVAKASESRTRAGQIDLAQQDFAQLSPAEREVAEHLAAGLLNKQIAGLTGRSENTVKVHRSRIMRKMRARSIYDLAVKMNEARVSEDGVSS